MAGSVKKAETSDYRLRNQLFIAALVAAVLGPFPVHGSWTVAAVESALEEFGEVTLAEAQRWRNAMPSSLSPAQFWTHSAFSMDNEMSLSSLDEHWQYQCPGRNKIVCATTFWLSWSMCKLAAYRQPGPHRPYARCTAWLLKGSSQLSWCHPYSSSSLSQPRWGSRLSVWSHCSSCPSTQNIYTPNKLGLVQASLKGNCLQRCWILPAIGTGSTTAVCLVAK